MPFYRVDETVILSNRLNVLQRDSIKITLCTEVSEIL